MSLAISCEVPFRNSDSWAVFQLAHFLRHSTIRVALSTSKVTPSKLDQASPEDTSWMQDHAVEHHDICAALNLVPNPNLGETDLRDEASFYQWMAMHRDEHELFDKALGL